MLVAIFNRIREHGLLEQLTSLDDYTSALRNYVQTDMSKNRMLEFIGLARDISPGKMRRYAIDSSAIVEPPKSVTFGTEPKALCTLVDQFISSSPSTGGK